MIDIDKIKAKAVAADTYWQIQEEIADKITVDYIWHDCRLEHNSKLAKYVGKRILSQKVVNKKRFKFSRDVLLAKNLFELLLLCVGRPPTVITTSLRQMLAYPRYAI